MCGLLNARAIVLHVSFIILALIAPLPPICVTPYTYVGALFTLSLGEVLSGQNKRALVAAVTTTWVVVALDTISIFFPAALRLKSSLDLEPASRGFLHDGDPDALAGSATNALGVCAAFSMTAFHAKRNSQRRHECAGSVPLFNEHLANSGQ